VERIVDKRRNKKGKWEYLIRATGRKEDTWEPEKHLLHCEEFIDQFNSLRPHTHKHLKPPKMLHGATAVAGPRPLAATAGRPALPDPFRARADTRKKKRSADPRARPREGAGPEAAGGGDSGMAQKQKGSAGGVGRQAPEERINKAMTFKPPASPGQLGQFVPNMRAPHNGLQNGEEEPGLYRALSRTPRPPPPPPPPDMVSKTPADVAAPGQQHAENLGSPLANGRIHLHSSAKRKLGEDKGYVFDKRLRYNVRQSDTHCRFRDIVVRKEEGFTHVLLSSQSTDNNALTPEIMKEVCRALGNAAADDSKLLLLSSVGTIFCSGLEPSYLIGRLSTDRRKESTRIADAVRDLVLAFIHFKKPIVVAVNGPALGLGASILPLCDVVWASEKAWFQTPCAALRLTPYGCSSYTFPQILGVALANEMLFCGRKLTAQEACSRGLVSQVFWPATFNQEVMIRVREMALCSSVVLEESKCLVRGILMSVLEEVNEKECQMLRQLWCSTKGLEALCSYKKNKSYDN
ncbi:LOW QUALITY PROTEIN: hypothetical protein CRUP_002904, partial [Coryphaenoides rupestris]